MGRSTSSSYHLWRNVGVVREGDRLRETVEIIDFWGRFVMDKTFDAVYGWETQNILSLARLVARAAELRRDSLGVHYRLDTSDAPTESPPTRWLVTRSTDGPVFSRAPADFGASA